MKNRKVLLLISALLFILALYVLWWRFWSVPTPLDAAKNLFQSVIAGDIEWLYSKTTETERKTEGFSKELLQEFYDNFLKYELKNANVIKYQPIHENIRVGVISAVVKLESGKEVELDCLAVVEGRNIYIGAVETLLFIASELHYYDDAPTSVERVKIGNKKFSEWFKAKGLEKHYNVQVDALVDFE